MHQTLTDISSLLTNVAAKAKSKDSSALSDHKVEIAENSNGGDQQHLSEPTLYGKSFETTQPSREKDLESQTSWYHLSQSLQYHDI